MTYRRPRRLCTRYGKTKPHAAKGLCTTCYPNVRHGPYRPGGDRTVSRSADAVADRYALYARYRAWGYTIAAAAEKAGVSARTGDRYEVRRKAEKEAQTP